MKYGCFDAAGWPTAFYDDAVHASMPDGTVPLTDAQWVEFVAHPGARRWDGTAPVAFPAPAIDLLAYASAAHKTARDGGVTLAGVRVKTDPESRALIAGAHALSRDDPAIVIDFKAETGWLVLPAAAMQALAIGVGRWVQACYTAYMQVSRDLEAGTVTAPAQIDAAFAALAPPD